MRSGLTSVAAAAGIASLALLAAPVDAVLPWSLPSRAVHAAAVVLGTCVATFAGIAIDPQQSGPAAGLVLLSSPVSGVGAALAGQLATESVRGGTLISAAVACACIAAALRWGQANASD